MMKSEGLRKCFCKFRNVGATVLKYTINWGHIRDWNMWSCLLEEDYIPRDVPRGHVVVYVGEDYCRRFVIKISLLKHPLFKALLDRSEEVFDFSAGSKLCIPCNENIFAIILQYVAASQQDQRSQLCFQGSSLILLNVQSKCKKTTMNFYSVSCRKCSSVENIIACSL